MKSLLLLLLMLVSICCHAQQLTGIVLDEQTAQPVKDAIISQGIGSTHTDARGIFHITINILVDSLSVYGLGYQRRKVSIKYINVRDTVAVYLQPLSSNLNEVTVFGRNRLKDSLFMRQQFAKQFNYTGPKLKDVFSQYKSPYDPPSASISVATLVGVLTKKKSKDYKLQQKLLNYESENYVDYAFSEELVARVTQLQGDSLAAFMRQYRPTKAYLQSATQYELMNYIKTNCAKYRGHE